jgi:hypothetical protein
MHIFPKISMGRVGEGEMGGERERIVKERDGGEGEREREEGVLYKKTFQF